MRLGGTRWVQTTRFIPSGYCLLNKAVTSSVVAVRAPGCPQLNCSALETEVQ